MSISTKNNSVNIQVNSRIIGGVSYPSDCVLKAEYVNGMKEGEASLTSSKKTKLARLHYHEDKLNGLCVFHDSHGIKVKECIYENDVQTGWGCEYKNDKVVFEGMYKNGERHSELKKYRIDSRFMEEVKNGKTLSICKLTEDHKRDGICYLYENGVLKSSVLFENGIEKKKLQEFRAKEMIEFDDDQHVVYKGEYRGNIPNGFERTGKGEEYKYYKGSVSEVVRLKDGVMNGKCRIEGNEMKEYEGDRLIYEGGYCYEDNDVMRNGNGVVWCSESRFYTAMFKKGVEKRKVKEVDNDVLIEYDKEGKVVYKGGYDKKGKKHTRKGKGQLFEYDDNRVKEVYDCENGERTVKRLEFEFSSMIELNENGGVVYKGDYKGTPRDGYMRNGEGDEFDKDDMLVYSGGWKNGKKEGSGILYENGDVRYNGEWRDNKPNGTGKLYDKNGNVVHEGKWKNGYFMVSNSIGIDYESLEKKGLLDNGSVKYEGEWNGNVYEGRGKELYENGNVKYEGEWRDNKPNGTGKMYDKNGKVKYEGDYLNGVYEGWGIEYDKEGKVMFEGNWVKGIPNGYGKCYDEGRVYEGKWENGVVLCTSHLCWFDYSNKEKTSIVGWCCQKVWKGFYSLLKNGWLSLFIMICSCICFIAYADSIGSERGLYIGCFVCPSVIEVSILGLFWIVLACSHYSIPCRCEDDCSDDSSRCPNGKKGDIGHVFIATFSGFLCMFKFLGFIIYMDEGVFFIVSCILSLCCSIHLQVNLCRFYYHK